MIVNGDLLKNEDGGCSPSSSLFDHCDAHHKLELFSNENGTRTTIDNIITSTTPFSPVSTNYCHRDDGECVYLSTHILFIFQLTLIKLVSITIRPLITIRPFEIFI